MKNPQLKTIEHMNHINANCKGRQKWSNLLEREANRCKRKTFLKKMWAREEILGTLIPNYWSMGIASFHWANGPWPCPLILSNEQETHQCEAVVVKDQTIFSKILLTCRSILAGMSGSLMSQFVSVDPPSLLRSLTDEVTFVDDVERSLLTSSVS